MYIPGDNLLLKVRQELPLKI